METLRNVPKNKVHMVKKTKNNNDNVSFRLLI